MTFVSLVVCSFVDSIVLLLKSLGDLCVLSGLLPLLFFCQLCCAFVKITLSQLLSFCFELSAFVFRQIKKAAPVDDALLRIERHQGLP